VIPGDLDCNKCTFSIRSKIVMGLSLDCECSELVSLGSSSMDRPD
jgi:hypothetical protein